VPGHVSQVQEIECGFSALLTEEGLDLWLTLAAALFTADGHQSSPLVLTRHHALYGKNVSTAAGRRQEWQGSVERPVVVGSSRSSAREDGVE
jgi:hypothetical protein